MSGGARPGANRFSSAPNALPGRRRRGAIRRGLQKRTGKRTRCARINRTVDAEIKCPLTAFGAPRQLIHLDNIVRMSAVLAAHKKSFGIRVIRMRP